MLKQGFDVDPLLRRQADCVTARSYEQFVELLAAGVSEDELVTFRYDEEGVATLGDGLYVLERRLASPAFADKLVRFVRATMRGWDWVAAHPEEATALMREHVAEAIPEAQQERMMREVIALAEGSDGSLDPAGFRRTVETLLAGGSDPVITAPPEGAYTHAITDQALD